MFLHCTHPTSQSHSSAVEAFPHVIDGKLWLCVKRKFATNIHFNHLAPLSTWLTRKLIFIFPVSLSNVIIIQFDVGALSRSIYSLFSIFLLIYFLLNQRFLGGFVRKHLVLNDNISFCLSAKALLPLLISKLQWLCFKIKF